jgi:hypothetical protein
MPKLPNSVVAYAGPSRIDGKPIVVIVTGLSGKSANAKTGAMVQTWIIRSDIGPMDALRTGQDASICGGCPHRPKSYDGTTWTGRSCYVNVSQAPNAVYKAFQRGAYPVVSLDELAELTRGKMVRLGSYGDPAAVPLEVWQAYTRHAAGRTGYTHQWRSARLRDVTALCQASVDSPEQAEIATSLGLGYFRVAPVGSDALPGEIRCPASAEAGKLKTCAECRMCDGAKGLPVVIDAHGIGASYVSKRAALPVLA